MNQWLVGFLLGVGLVNAVVAITVFMRTRGSSLRWTFLLLVLATSSWAWGIALFLVASNANYAQFYLNSYYVAALAIGCGVIAFGYRLTGGKSPYIPAVSYVPAIGLTGLFFLNPQWLITVNNVGNDLNGRVTIHSLPYIMYAIIFLVCFAMGWALIKGALGNQSATRRKHQQVVALGVIVGGVFGIVFNLLLPAMGHYEYIGIGPLFSLLFTYSVTFAIVKHSLFDLRNTFLSSLTYILAISSAALVYGAGVWLVGSVITVSVNDELVVAAVYIILALIAALTINPLRDFFDTYTARLFFRDRHRPEEALDSFGNAILDDVDVQSIAQKAMAVIDEVMHPTFVAVILTERDDATAIQQVYTQNSGAQSRLEKLGGDMQHATLASQAIFTDAVTVQDENIVRLQKAGISIICRMQIRDDVVGYIAVGEKRSGNSYGTSDVLMLSSMADEAALAVVNSQRFDEIQLFNIRLKREVSAATRQLRLSNKKLIEMDATKDEFVSMASHQLRTPLTSVKGYISMVLEGDAGEITDAQRQLLTEAYTSSERMVHLIGDFLNVSRLQTGKFMIDRRNVDLANIVKQEIEVIRQIAESHNIKVVYKRPERFPLLYLDEGKLRQVIMNFIDNAIYYSPESTTITVTLAIEDGDAVLRVKDKGMGVPPDEQHQLFTKFFRADNARRQRPDGTGIGLYLAKRIIDGHAGKLVFESTLGKGSTFGFRLPIKKLSSPPPPLTVDDSQQKTTP